MPSSSSKDGSLWKASPARDDHRLPALFLNLMMRALKLLLCALFATQSSAFVAVAKPTMRTTAPVAAARCAEAPKMVIG